MADIIPLAPPKMGAQSFLTCGCGKGDTMLVVVIHDAQGAFISTLVCSECENEIAVSFGRTET